MPKIYQNDDEIYFWHQNLTMTNFLINENFGMYGISVFFFLIHQESFERAKELVEEVFDSRPPRLLHIAIVGNKVDLKNRRRVEFQVSFVVKHSYNNGV